MSLAYVVCVQLKSSRRGAVVGEACPQQDPGHVPTPVRLDSGFHSQVWFLQLPSKVNFFGYHKAVSSLEGAFVCPGEKDLITELHSMGESSGAVPTQSLIPSAQTKIR